MAEKLSGIRSKKSEEISQTQNELRLAQSGNEEMNSYILNFFDASLKDNSESKDCLLNKYRNYSSNRQEPYLEFVAKGISEPLTYDLDSQIAPAPRQLRFIIARDGINKTISILN